MNLARSEAVASSVYVADQSLRMKENLPGRAKSQNCQFELVVCSVAFPTTRNLPLSILLQSLMSVSCLLVFCPLQLPLPTTLKPSAQRFIIGCVVSLPRHSPSNSYHPFPVLVQWICTSKGTSFRLCCFFFRFCLFPFCSCEVMRFSRFICERLFWLELRRSRGGLLEYEGCCLLMDRGSRDDSTVQRGE